MAELPPGRGAGERITAAAVASTALLVVTSAVAAAVPDPFGIVHAATSIACFLAGTVAMLAAYAIGVSRSRAEAVSTVGLFLLADDVAPPEVRRLLRASLAVQVLAVVVAASIRPYTEVAFGVLAPMLGLGLMGLWGARHGRFPPRVAP